MKHTKKVEIVSKYGDFHFLFSFFFLSVAL
jgi:hypothetical protein